MQTIQIKLQNGSTQTVEKFAGFDHEIAGQTFRFAVTQDVDAITRSVTHAKSGMRVCPLSVGASYLPAFAHLGSDVERAKLSLNILCEKHGAERVRSVIAAAE